MVWHGGRADAGLSTAQCTPCRNVVAVYDTIYIVYTRRLPPPPPPPRLGPAEKNPIHVPREIETPPRARAVVYRRTVTYKARVKRHVRRISVPDGHDMIMYVFSLQVRHYGTFLISRDFNGVPNNYRKKKI